MSKSVAQSLQFTIQVQQTFDIQPSETLSHPQSLTFTPATGYLLFDVKPATSIPQDGQ